MIHVGVDIHKAYCQACIKNSEGLILEEFRFQNSIDGADQLTTTVKKHGDAKVALE
jgi:transposase